MPAVSETENEPAPAVAKLEVTAPPPSVAVDVAVIVQTVGDVCTIPVIEEMLVKSKSVPFTVERVEQAIASLPVSVKVIVPDALFAAEAARVTVGAVVSIVTLTAVDAVEVLKAASVANAVIALLPGERTPVVHENEPPVAVHVLPVATPSTYS